MGLFCAICTGSIAGFVIGGAKVAFACCGCEWPVDRIARGVAPAADFLPPTLGDSAVCVPGVVAAGPALAGSGASLVVANGGTTIDGA